MSSSRISVHRSTSSPTTLAHGVRTVGRFSFQAISSLSLSSRQEFPASPLLNDIQLSDYKRKWNFIFQMLPDLPAELTKGKEDIYVGWWFKNKVYKPGAVPPRDVAAYVAAYAREGRMDAAFDYCRKIVDDMEFNKKQFTGKLPFVSWQSAGNTPFRRWEKHCGHISRNVTSVVIPDAGHFVPEEQPEALAKALSAFLGGG